MKLFAQTLHFERSLPVPRSLIPHSQPTFCRYQVLVHVLLTKVLRGTRCCLHQRRMPCILCCICLFLLIVCLHDSETLTQFFFVKTQKTPIPKLIWQIFLDENGPPGHLKPARQSWSALNPDHALELIDRPGLSFWLGNYLRDRPHLRRVLADSTPRVFKADILRYILLAQYGGVYTDVDVMALKPVATWIPEEYQGLAELVVGIEYDQLDWDGRWPGLEHSVQFCQWTMMAAPGHEVLRTIVDRATYAVLDLADKQSSDLGSLNLTNNDDVIATTGPGIWTAVILEYLRKKSNGVDLQYRDFSNLTKPTLLEDVLLLPVNAFATGQEHSGSVHEGSPDALVRHAFSGSWKEDDQYNHWKTERLEHELLAEFVSGQDILEKAEDE